MEMTIKSIQDLLEACEEAKSAGYDYGEISTDAEKVHFCKIENNSTPLNWSWGIDCEQFWL